MKTFQDSKGYIWIYTYDGLNRYDGTEFFIYRPEKTDTNALINTHILSDFEDNNGKLWLRTEHNIPEIFDPNTQQFSVPHF